MKAIAKIKPGKGLELIETEVPSVTKNSVLIKVKACGICGADVHLYKWEEYLARLMASRLPLIVGHEICGEVVDKGSEVTNIKIGDRVVTEPAITCGVCPQCADGRTTVCEKRINIGIEVNGGMAEYVSVPGSVIYKLPDAIPDAEASIIETHGVGVHGLERMPVIPGSSVAVLGAGPIGLLLMQCIKAAGAYPVIVTGTSRSRSRLERARQLGADATILADKENITERIKELTDGRGVDQVFEAAGTGKAILQALDITKRGGQICLLGATDDPVELKPFVMMRSKEIDIINARGRTASTWRRAITLAATGKVKLAPIIDRVLSLGDALQGFELLENNRDIIKIVVRP